MAATSPSPPYLRLVPGSGTTTAPLNSLTASSYRTFAKAFELATGWTLRIEPTKPQRAGDSAKVHGKSLLEESIRVRVDDLSDLTFGKALVGRRYAERLIEAVNALLREQKRAGSVASADIGCFKTRRMSSRGGASNSERDLFAGRVASQHETLPSTSRRGDHLVGRSNRHMTDVVDGSASADFATKTPALPSLVNFEIGASCSLTHASVVAFHTNRKGITFGLSANLNGTAASSTVGDKTGLLVAAARLETAFLCLANSEDSVQTIYRQVVALMDRLDCVDVITQLSVVAIRDREFEVEVCGSQSHRVVIADECLGRIIYPPRSGRCDGDIATARHEAECKFVNHYVMEGARAFATGNSLGDEGGASSQRLWVGFGQSVVLVRSLQGEFDWYDVFQTRTLSHIEQMNMGEFFDAFARLMSRTHCNGHVRQIEPKSSFPCPLIIRRKKW